MHLDLGDVLNETTQDLKDSLQRAIATLATAHNVTIDIPSAQEGLKNLIKALAKNGRVVVLIDEYDKPLMDRLQTHRSGRRQLVSSWS